MRRICKQNGFSALELMIACSIFSLALAAIFMSMNGIHDTLQVQSSRNTVGDGATRAIQKLGQDIRETSYAYLIAGDWYATRQPGGIDITVTRNYFSSNPLLGGVTLVPGISTEGWAQCANSACGWNVRFTPGGFTPILPHAFLGQLVRNNAQSTTPFNPPPSFQYSAQETRGRLYSHLAPGDACPICGSALSANSFFGGLMLFSPRAVDGTFSYNAAGNVPEWSSMVFYCPFRSGQGVSDLRRYVFYVSSLNVNASLEDLLDFDNNGIIESPPMTDSAGDFVLDAEGEIFSLDLKNTNNDLLYRRWDSVAGRSFRIEVNRSSGIAAVTVVGGTYDTGGTVSIQLVMERFATGLSDFEVSHFINNPSWDVLGVTTNPTGVAEPASVRVTLQIDRSRSVSPSQVETIQSLQFQPRN